MVQEPRALHVNQDISKSITEKQYFGLGAFFATDMSIIRDKESWHWSTK